MASVSPGQSKSDNYKARLNGFNFYPTFLSNEMLGPFEQVCDFVENAEKLVEWKSRIKFKFDQTFVLLISKDLDKQFIIKISEKKRRFEVILA